MRDIRIIRKDIYLAAALLLMAGCTTDGFIGDEELGELNGKAPISFSLSSGTVTRLQTDGTAANTLNSNFVVWGSKNVGGSPQTVFDNYQVNYVTGTGNSTGTNSPGWEYVSYKNVPNGVQSNTGVSAYAASAANTNGLEQTIKYWDFVASSYDFYAYSLGKGDEATSTYAKSGAMSSNSPYYYLEGTQAQLAACYLSNKYNITYFSAAASQVTLHFRKLAAKAKMGFYETIPGYSVKEVKFYSSSSSSAGDVPYLYASSGSSMPNNGKFTVTFDTDGKPVLSWEPAASNGSIANVAFGSGLTLDGTKDYKEDNSINYLQRSSRTATMTDEITVLPNPNGALLNLKIDYTLVSRDGTGEEIHVTGATAVIPQEFAKWKPNYAYTYLFKITDDKLTPITLDAIVHTDPLGYQETITTVTEPSITTYANGRISTTSGYDYTAGTIYVVVGNGTPTLTPGTNANLYEATLTPGTGTPTLTISEETVANAIEQGGTVTDGTGAELTVAASTATLSAFTSIPAEDAPHGVALTINGAKFTAVTGKTYVFEYISYDAGTVLAAGANLTNYYTKSGGTYTAASGTADGTTTYYKLVKTYKVIRIQ